MLAILNQVEKINEVLAKYKGSLLIDYKIFVRLSAIIETYIVTNHKAALEVELKEFDAYKIKFAFYKEADLEDSIALKSIFEANTKNYGLKHRFHSLLDDDYSIRLRKETNDFKKEKRMPPIVTFYSYKGGMGRTTTMTTYGLQLAQHYGLKVAIMDFDLEAPGYLNFFNLDGNKDLELGKINGIVEYILDSQFSKKSDNLVLHKVVYDEENNRSEEGYCTELDSIYTGQDGKVFIFPAGNLLGENNQNHYLQGLARLDLASEEKFIDAFKNLFLRITTDLKPDIILIDSRTGFNDIYGMIALIMSDVIVGFFGSSKQTKPGIEFLLDKVQLLNDSELELLLVNSILPEGEQEMGKFHESFTKHIEEIRETQVNNNSVGIAKLRRYPKLEKVGLVKTFTEDILTSAVKNKEIPDLEEIFTKLNNYKIIQQILPKPQELLGSAELREQILKILLDKLPDPYAEANTITTQDFFYRKSMSEIFQKNKFLVRGFKGTGKTYLYKALKDSSLSAIQEKLKQKAGKIAENFVFIDVISETGTKNPNKRFLISSLNKDEMKENRNFYLTYFWVVYTWNAIMLDKADKIPDFETTVSKELKQFIQKIEPNQDTALRFDTIIKSRTFLVQIENDLSALNKHLQERNTHLVILYDQLDNLILSNFGLIVSPLVDYWWTNKETFSQFYPKIFIRTDLFEKLTGTNTERWNGESTISIEWNKNEVYAYFFKIVFANARKEFNLFLEVHNKKSEFENILNQIDAENQIPEQEMYLKPLMEIFFGELVITGSYNASRNYKHPYDWFFDNLSNAGKKSISLRPFVSLLKGAVEYAIKKTSINLPIIHSTYYANMSNRDDVAERHFKDLANEVNNQDLKKIFDYLRKFGDEYKFTFLTENELESFLSKVIDYYNGMLEENQNTIQLTQLLEANGILAREVQWTKVIYRFPEIYKYWLGLRTRKGEDIGVVSRSKNANYLGNTNLTTQIKALKVNDIVNCKITGFHPNEKTVFVMIEGHEDKKAAIHRDKLSISFSGNVSDFQYKGKKVHIGQVLIAKVININKEGEGKVNLSLII
jgi:cellulose biosynthesis protein BcsQ